MQRIPTPTKREKQHTASSYGMTYPWPPERTIPPESSFSRTTLLNRVSALDPTPLARRPETSAPACRVQLTPPPCPQLLPRRPTPGQEIMGAEFMVKYRRFAAIHLASHLRVVWCPACHCGVVPSAAAAAAAAARRSSVIPMPDLQQGQMAARFNGSSLWDLWGAGRGAAGLEAERPEEEGGGAVARPRASFCIGCPGCQASLCMLCRELHAPGISCADAAAGAAAAEEQNDEEGGSGGSGGGGEGSGAARRTSTGSQNDVEELDDSPTKRCPGCHVPIFKDGG